MKKKNNIFQDIVIVYRLSANSSSAAKHIVIERLENYKSAKII